MPSPLWILNCCIQNSHNTDWMIMRLIHGDGNCDWLLFRKATWFPQSLKLLVPIFTNHDFEDTYTCSCQISPEINLFKTATSKSSRKLEKVHKSGQSGWPLKSWCKGKVGMSSGGWLHGKSQYPLPHPFYGLMSWKGVPSLALWADIVERDTQYPLYRMTSWKGDTPYRILLSDDHMERWDASLGWENKKIMWG